MKVNIFDQAGTAATWQKGSWFKGKQYMKSTFRNNYNVPVELDIWKIKFRFSRNAMAQVSPLNSLLNGLVANGLTSYVSYAAGPPETVRSPIMQCGLSMAAPVMKTEGWVAMRHHNVFLNPDEEVSVSAQTRMFHRFQEKGSAQNYQAYLSSTVGYIVRVRGRPGHGDNTVSNPSTQQGWMEGKLDCQHLVRNYVRGRSSVAGMVTKHEWIDPTFGTALEVMMRGDPTIENAPE